MRSPCVNRVLASCVVVSFACANEASGTGGPASSNGGSPAAERGSFGDGFLYGSVANDGATAVRVAADGSVYVAGATGGGLVEGEPLGGKSDAFVTRIAPNGKIAWTRMLFSELLDGATGLFVHPEGGVIVTTGSSGGSITVGHVVRVDAAGNVRWNVSVPPMTPMSAAVGRNGHVFVAGYAHRYAPTNPIFGAPTTTAVNGAADGALLELAADGTPLRGRLFPYTSDSADGATAFFSYAEAVHFIPGTDTAYIVGNQQNYGRHVTAWIRKWDLTSFSLSWTRFFNASGLGAQTDPVYDEKTQSSTLSDFCVDRRGNARVGWNGLLSTLLDRPTLSVVDADGNELQRTRLPTISVENEGIVAMACDPASDDVTVAVGQYAPINLDTSFHSALVRVDAQGNVRGKHLPVVTPFAPATSANAKVMSVAYGTAGLFFAGETAGTFQGSEGKKNLQGSNVLATDVLVGRLDTRF